MVVCMNNISTPNRTSLILHGHFYQPPRENPETGIIPKQNSAKPYEDWNERIFADCYSTNAHSRYLSQYGHVESITNNFEYISYNFGPTLLSWIESHHPDIHQRIVDADASSIKRLGHGNAMAQSFNHTILPLDKPADAHMQILWGIADFQRRFKRDPEGMWLPEAAINKTVIDLLAQSGIKFVVLSPWQAKAVQQEDGSWAELAGRPAPYDRPYVLTGNKGGTIAAFFYHPGLAEGISFGHALRNADALYETLAQIKANDHAPLIHTATDGEIYGHHEPFGDMALAALIRKVSDRDDFQFTNYATYLAEHPATLHAQLHDGEGGLGTSWSCSHGVSRWWKDCGCHTGGEEGWNQEWRTPLRVAFNALAQKLDVIFDQQVARIFSGAISGFDLLKMSAPAICGQESMQQLIQDLHQQLQFSSDEDTNVAVLLDGMKNKGFAFTSCGWFFSDLAGIEPRQNIRYAIYALNQYSRFTTEDLLTPLLKDLSLAKCNKKNDGTGMTLAKADATTMSGSVEAALYFVLNRRIAPPDTYSQSYGRFSLTQWDSDGKSMTVRLCDTISLEEFTCNILSDGLQEKELKMFLGLHDSKGTCLGKYSLANTDIPPRMLDEVYGWIDRSLSRVTDNDLASIGRDINNYSMLMRNSRYLPMETLYIENIGTCLRAIKSLFITPDTLPWSQKRESIGQLIDFIHRKGRPSEIAAVVRIFSAQCNNVAQWITTHELNHVAAEYMADLIAVAREQGIQPDITQVQNAVYPYLCNELTSDVPADQLRQLARNLNFEVHIMDTAGA